VIGVDWEKLAQNPLYNVARANTKPVGEYLATLLNFLSESAGAQLSDVHCLGHSLGAHVCGYNGKALDGAIGRITGKQKNCFFTKKNLNHSHRLSKNTIFISKSFY